MAEREWSKYQRAIFKAVTADQRDLVVEALAGSGKTSTIVESLNYIQRGTRTLMSAFNKSIAKELATRVPRGIDVKTLHGLGFKAVCRSWGSQEVDPDRVAKMAEQVVAYGTNDQKLYYWRLATTKLVGLAKNLWIDEEQDLIEAADEFEVNFRDINPELWIPWVQELLRQSKQQTGTIDFDDMVWLPCELGLPIDQYGMVFVDETQDLNACQLELIQRACDREEGGRIVAVGDRRQAIYGFRGADENAIPRMIEELNARVLPLSITYRCPLSVVRLAQQIVPQLEAWEGVKEGQVAREPTREALFAAQPGDFVLSRLNAPLMKVCMEMIRRGMRATIQGRDIGRNLQQLIKASQAKTVPDLQQYLQQYTEQEQARLAKRRRAEQKIEQLFDKVRTIEVLMEGCGSIQGLLDKMEQLFSDQDGTGKIVCSTVHKAKGREADRVWLLDDTLRPGESIEHDNICYVAYTRAKDQLRMVTGWNDGQRVPAVERAIASVREKGMLPAGLEMSVGVGLGVPVRSVTKLGMTNSPFNTTSERVLEQAAEQSVELLDEQELDARVNTIVATTQRLVETAGGVQTAGPIKPSKASKGRPAVQKVVRKGRKASQEARGSLGKRSAGPRKGTAGRKPRKRS